MVRLTCGRKGHTPRHKPKYSNNLALYRARLAAAREARESGAGVEPACAGHDSQAPAAAEAGTRAVKLPCCLATRSCRRSS